MAPRSGSGHSPPPAAAERAGRPTTFAEPPLVSCCRGGSPGARLAARTAAALAELAIAEAVEDVDLLVSQARAGRAVIAIDGCPSACSARLLEAKGASPRFTLNLRELGVDVQGAGEEEVAQLAAEIATRIRQRPTSGRRGRPPRPARPDPASRLKRTHGVEDYLIAIDALASTVLGCGALAADAPALAAHVSHLLSVSRVSAGQMLARLQAAGLIERSARKELMLTATGRAAADRAVWRHRLLERLATDFLGYPPTEAYEQARMLDGAFGDEAIGRVASALGGPERCPHGWPIDPVRARAESRELSTLTTLLPGDRATVARLVEHDGPALARLYELRLVPGTALVLADAGTASKMDVRIGETRCTIDSETAARVLVRRCG